MLAATATAARTDKTIRRGRSRCWCRRRPAASATSCRASSARSLPKAAITPSSSRTAPRARAWSRPKPSPRRRRTATRCWSATRACSRSGRSSPRCPTIPLKDFAPIVLLVSVPNILVVHPSVPAQSLQELLAYARANPGKLTYSSQGIGASGHIAAELLKLAAGVDITHVPFRGAAPAAQALAAGHVHMMFDVVSLALGPIQSGTVRAIGVASKERVERAARRADAGRARLPRRDRRMVRAARTRRHAAAVIGWLEPRGQPRVRRPRIRASSSSPRAPPCHSAGRRTSRGTSPTTRRGSAK